MGKRNLFIMFVKIFHALIIVYYLVVWFGLRAVVEKANEQDASLKHISALSTRYLTNWNLFLQTMFFLVCVLHDFQDKISFFKKRNDQIKQLMDFWFFTICQPISMFVAIAFWSLYSYDKSLILPLSFDKALTPWVNHAIHTNVVVLAFLEMIFVYRRLPNLIVSLAAITVFMIAYGACIYGTYFEQNIWVYPIYNRLNEVQQVILTLAFYVCAVFCLFFTRLTKYCVDSVKQPPKSIPTSIPTKSKKIR